MDPGRVLLGEQRHEVLILVWTCPCGELRMGLHGRRERERGGWIGKVEESDRVSLRERRD